MGWLVLGLRPAGARRGVTQKRYGSRTRSRNVLRASRWRRSDRNGVRALMKKVLIGVDPHKASLAVAAVDEAKGELLERASFPQDRAGLRSLERWAKRFPERRWAVENAGGLGRYLAGRLAASGESVVDVPPKLSARVRVLSTGNSRKNDGLDADAASEVLRQLSERRLLTWWPSVPERSTACMGSCGTSSPAGWPGGSRPAEPRASCAAYGRKAPRLASAVDWLRRSCATSGRSIGRSLT